jgi:hypothetical protein
LNFDGDVAALEKAFEPAVDANQPAQSCWKASLRS